MTSTSTQRRPLLGLRAQPGRLALRFMRLPLTAYRHDMGYVLGRTFVEFDHVGRKSGTTYQAVAMVLRYDGATGEVVICRGGQTDWFRNLQAHPAPRVRLGRTSFVPQQRILSDEEAVEVVEQFRAEHPYRVRLISRLLGWDLHGDAAVRAFVREHRFVAFRPATGP